MKPHPSIFEAALKLAGVPAAEAMMVGDSLTQDIEGARRVGMRGVLVQAIRAGSASARRSGVPVIRSLLDIAAVLCRRADGEPLYVSSCECTVCETPSPTRRPAQRSAGKQVQMDVKDRLSRVAIRVEDSR